MRRFNLLPRLAAAFLSVMLVLPAYAEDVAKSASSVDTPLPGDTPAAADSSSARHAVASPHVGRHSKSPRRVASNASGKHGKVSHVAAGKHHAVRTKAGKAHVAAKAKPAGHAKKSLKKRR